MKKEIYGIDSFIFGIINGGNEEKGKEKKNRKICLFDIIFWILIVFTIAIRVHLAPISISGDFKGYFTDWMNSYSKEPFWKAFGHSFTDYYEPYNFLLDLFGHTKLPGWLCISMSSCFFDYLSAYYVYKIVKMLLLDNKSSFIGKFSFINNIEVSGEFVVDQLSRLAAIVSLMLPIVVMNGALWKQCDSIYTCFSIISIYYFFKEQYTVSFLLYGMSFMFKLQSIFLLPFLLIMYICKQKFSLTKFCYIPVMYVLAGIPAVICKRGFHATYLKYLVQTQEVPMMSALSPSIYRFGMDYFREFGMYAILLTISVFMIMTALCYLYRKNLDRQTCFYLVGWSVITCFLFLPAMHERYDYMGLVILSVYMIIFNHKYIWTIIVMNICTTMTYSYYLFDFDSVSLEWITVAYNIAFAFITVDLIRRICRNNTYEAYNSKKAVFK